MGLADAVTLYLVALLGAVVWVLIKISDKDDK